MDQDPTAQGGSGGSELAQLGRRLCLDGWRRRKWRRRAAGGELWRRIAGVGRNGLPALDSNWARVREHVRNTAKRTRGSGARVGGRARALHGEWRLGLSRRAISREGKQEGGETGSASSPTLLGSFGGGSGVEESNRAVAQRRQPSSIPTMAARTRVLASGEAAASVQGLGGSVRSFL